MTDVDVEELALHSLGAPARKAAGESKELHETRLAGAPNVLDVHAYVDDFNASVVDAYRRGVADVELPSETGVARSIIPPGRPPPAISAASPRRSRSSPSPPASAAWPA